MLKLKTYRVIARTMAHAVPWQYDFDQATEPLAISYASRIARQLASCPWFLGLELFAKGEQEGDFRPLCFIKTQYEITFKVETL